MTNTYYVGLDIHKETIAIAYATGGTREDSVYHGPCGGSVLAAERALRINGVCVNGVRALGLTH